MYGMAHGVLLHPSRTISSLDSATSNTTSTITYQYMCPQGVIRGILTGPKHIGQASRCSNSGGSGPTADTEQLPLQLLLDEVSLIISFVLR